MENKNELTIFDMIDEMATRSRGEGKRKSPIKDILDEVMAGQSFNHKHKPIRGRDPFIHNPLGPIITPPTAKKAARALGTSVGQNVDEVTYGLTEMIDDLSKNTAEDMIPTMEYDLLNFKPVAGYIIGYEDCRDLLIRGIRAYFGGTYDPAATFNREEAGRALHALLEDYLTQRECWHDDYSPGSEKLLCSTMRYDYIMSKYIPPRYWYLPDNVRLDFGDALASYALNVTEVIRNMMFDKLSAVIPDKTYDIYRTTRTAGGVLLEKGPDFRVVDWTRRMGNGEWL